MPNGETLLENLKQNLWPIPGPAAILPWVFKQGEKLSTMAGAQLTAPWRLRETFTPQNILEPSWRNPLLPTGWFPGGKGYEEYEKWEEPKLAQFEPPFRLPWTPEETRQEPWTMGLKGMAELAPWILAGGGTGRAAIKAGEMLPRAGMYAPRVAPPRPITQPVPEPMQPPVAQRPLLPTAERPALPTGVTERPFIETPIPGGVMRAETPRGTIEVTPQMVKADVERIVSREFYDAIQGSPLDVASTSYLRTGKFQDFINNMPQYTKMTAYEAEQLGLALRTLPSGRSVPAMRRSGFYATEEFAKAPMVDIPQASGALMDTARMFQAIDGGYFGRAAQKFILWPIQRTTLAKIKFADSQKYLYHDLVQKYNLAGDKGLRQKAGDILQHINKEEATALVGDLLKKPDISKFLKRLKPADQQRVVKFAQETRKLFDDLIDKQNLARGKRGQDAIPYRDNYRPWVIESNVWSKFFGLQRRPKDIMQAPQMPDFIKPLKPFNPREMARRGGLYGYEKERDLLKLMNDYVDTASKDIFNTNMVHNARIHTATMRSMGLNNSASLIDDWAGEAFAGTLPTISRGIRKVVPMQAITPGLWLRRRLTAAVFPLNWTWNVFVQTSSGALTIMRYGVRNTLHGLDYIFSPTARNATRENAYSWIVKQRMAGKVAYQDIGGGIEKTLRLEGSKLEKVEHYANFLTNKLEELLTGISVRAAYHDGIKKGLSGRQLWEYASEGGAKTQSMYNLENIPGILRAKEVGAAVPFQTFAFEVFNSVRELNIIGIRKILGRAGAYETTSAKTALGKATIQKRVKMLLEWMAALTTVNVVVDKAINRKPWSTSSFIPFFAVLTGGMNAGNPWNQILPLKYSQELKGGIDNIIKYGEWRKLRKWAIRYHMIGGVQIERTLEGLEAVLEGRVKDVSGRTLFTVSPDEAIKALTMGPYSTEKGKEYIDKMQRAKGPLSEYTGIPMPTTTLSPEEQQIWSRYPPELRRIAKKIKELEKTDPVAAKRLQWQYPQIMSARREIALAQIEAKRQKALEKAAEARARLK